MNKKPDYKKMAETYEFASVYHFNKSLDGCTFGELAKIRYKDEKEHRKYLKFVKEMKG